MKRLTIKELENKSGNIQQMIWTDVLEIPLSLVRYINKHHFPTLKEKKVGYLKRPLIEKTLIEYRNCNIFWNFFYLFLKGRVLEKKKKLH